MLSHYYPPSPEQPPWQPALRQEVQVLYLHRQLTFWTKRTCENRGGRASVRWRGGQMFQRETGIATRTALTTPQ